MENELDTNAAIWKSESIVSEWAAKSSDRDRTCAGHWRTMGELLPFAQSEQFTFLDLGAGTGSASRVLLDLFPMSNAILADFSHEMMRAGEDALRPYAGRYRYVEFDMSGGEWPDEIPSAVDAVITSLCVHHLPDERKLGLFAEIFGHLAPGGWYVNYDPVTSTDPVVEATWQRVNDRRDPDAPEKRQHRTLDEQARYENHVRYMIPLDQQIAYLRSAGFEGVDVYWRDLENVIYGGCRPKLSTVEHSSNRSSRVRSGWGHHRS